MKLYDKYEAVIACRRHDFWWHVRGVGVRVEENSRNEVWEKDRFFCDPYCCNYCYLLIVLFFFCGLCCFKVTREYWPASYFHLCPVCCTVVLTQGCWLCGSDRLVLPFQMVCFISVKRWWRNHSNSSACLNLRGVWKANQRFLQLHR